MYFTHRIRWKARQVCSDQQAWLRRRAGGPTRCAEGNTNSMIMVKDGLWLLTIPKGLPTMAQTEAGFYMEVNLWKSWVVRHLVERATSGYRGY
jgi:hypothetical protein